MTQLLPHPRELGAVPETLERDLADIYRPQEGVRVRLNLVSSLNGSLVAPDGTSGPLSNPNDRAILRAIRRCADVVLIGGRTVRRERVIGPTSPPLAVISRTGDLAQAQLPRGHRIIVLTPPGVTVQTPDHLRVEHVPLGQLADGPDLATCVEHLQRIGLSRVVCEGGPQIASAALDAGIVDELCLSLVGRISPVSGLEALAPRLDRGARLRSLIHDPEHSALYTRWSVSDTGVGSV